MLASARKAIASRLSLKFSLALTALTLLLAGAGATLLVQRESAVLDESLRGSGKSLGLFLSLASIDPLLYRDQMKLDALVENAKKVDNLLYAYVVDAKGVPKTSVMGSFNEKNPDVAALIASREGSDLPSLAQAVMERFPVTELRVPVELEGTPMGTVVIGLSRAASLATVRRTTLYIVLFALLITAALVITVVFMFRVIITRPLEKAALSAALISGGDLRGAITVGTTDEVGRLCESLNSMGTNLRGTVSSIHIAARDTSLVSQKVRAGYEKLTEGSRLQSSSVERASQSVLALDATSRQVAMNTTQLQEQNQTAASSVLEMVASTEEISNQATALSLSAGDTASAITEISASIRQVATSVETLSRFANEMASSVNQMVATIRTVEGLARSSSEQAEEMSQAASQAGLDAMDKTRQGMEEIRLSAHRSSEVIDNLRSRSQDVRGILDVIHGITEQTTLLALNAEILAAQAGDHGRGFAVVAAEIRDLATRTNDSTKEIAGVISGVTSGATTAAEAMQEGITRAEEGSRVAADADRILRQLIDKAGRSRDMTRQIESITREQSQGMDQIALAVGRTNEMIQQIAQATHEQKSGSETILTASNEISDTTRRLARAIDNQAMGGRTITVTVETVATRIDEINRAIVDQRSGSQHLVESIGQIKEVLSQYQEMANDLLGSVEELHQQAESLKGNIENFKV